MQGGVEALATIGDRSVDLLLCLNVAAYFTDAEGDLFYSETQRVLRPGAALVITHSNELFDLFSLNAFTVEFFKDNFGADPTALLTHPDKPTCATYNVRENPLAYRHKLARYCLTEEPQAFSNHHPVPPLLQKGDKDYPDTLLMPDQWKLMFSCSTFGSKAIKPR
ncbi:MAG: hypothetical protein WKF52_00415 [Sphingomicrobium sp.]